ncbi:MAG: hypothetical protein ACE5GV_03880 [Candidatus Scalindua sp.]
MRIREAFRTAICLATMSLVLAGGTVAFSQEATTSVYKNSFSLEPDRETKEKKSDSKANRKKEERGLNLARQALKWTDTLPGKRTKAEMMDNELDSLIEREKYLTTAIQRLQIGLMRKKAKYARNPELLKVSVKQYSQKIAEMEDELAEIRKRKPTVESKLARVTIEVEAEELGRGIMEDEEDTGWFDEEFEEAKEERWKKGKGLLKIGALSTPRFR